MHTLTQAHTNIHTYVYSIYTLLRMLTCSLVLFFFNLLNVSCFVVVFVVYLLIIYACSLNADEETVNNRFVFVLKLPTMHLTNKQQHFIIFRMLRTNCDDCDNDAS